MNKPTSNQSTAVEPAQAVPVGYCLMPREPTQWMREQIACGIESNSVADVWGRLIRAVDIENKHRAKEPAQAVPAWLPIETAPKDGTEILVTYGKQGFVMQLVRFDRTFNYWKSKGEAELGLENNATHWIPIPDPRKQLYTAPPAIDDQTRKMVLGLCKLIIDNAGPDSMITRHMAQVAEKICNNLEAGNGE